MLLGLDGIGGSWGLLGLQTLQELAIGRGWHCSTDSNWSWACPHYFSFLPCSYEQVCCGPDFSLGYAFSLATHPQLLFLSFGLVPGNTEFGWNLPETFLQTKMILLAVGSELFPFCAELCSTWGWTNIVTNARTVLWAWLSRIWSNNHISYRSGWECLEVSENL